VVTHGQPVTLAGDVGGALRVVTRPGGVPATVGVLGRGPSFGPIAVALTVKPKRLRHHRFQVTGSYRPHVTGKVSLFRHGAGRVGAARTSKGTFRFPARALKPGKYEVRVTPWPSLTLVAGRSATITRRQLAFGPMSEDHEIEEEAEGRRYSPERLARRRAALAQLTQYGNPILRSVASPVTRFDNELAELAGRMGFLMDEAIGVGLAGPQVGVLKRLFVYRFADEEALGVLVNPEVVRRGEELQTIEEGCLSIPDVHVPVERPALVEVTGVDLDGHPLTVVAEGPDATVLQHEIDHLDGVLMLDRTDKASRKAALRALREAALGV
jgi:peptide deformylase